MAAEAAIGAEYGPRTVAVLHDLVHFAESAARLVAGGEAAYFHDETRRLASEAIAHKIGEATARLPDQFVADHPEVPWRSMRGLRNIVAHQYDRIDYEIIWKAFVRRLPENAEAIRDILGSTVGVCPEETQDHPPFI